MFFGWALQVLLLASVTLRPGGRIPLPEPSVAFCAAALLGGWAFRLAVLFALASGGYHYWIGDDPLRWLTAWEWAHGRVGVISEPGAWLPSTWMPGTYWVHGLAIRWAPNPLVASKLVSAIYSVMSLVGIFVFTLAVFRHRGIAAVCVVFLTPLWIDVLLSSGTMTEMPVVGAMLVGAGALISALRAPEGLQRQRFLLAAGASFAVATMFHVVAWIALTAVLLFVLLLLLSQGQPGLVRRLRDWLILCVVSTLGCFVWTLQVWRNTGSPFTPFQTVGATELFKIGGSTHVLDFLSLMMPQSEKLVVLLAVVFLVVFICLARYADPRDRLMRLARWGTGLAALALCAASVRIVASRLGLLRSLEFDRLVDNWTVYPVSLAFCSFTFLPLLIFGVVSTWPAREDRSGEVRAVVACIAFAFAIFVATAVNGGANITPYRTMLVLSSALLPFALAPLFELRSEEDGAPSTRTGRTITLSFALAVAVLGHHLVANSVLMKSRLPDPVFQRTAPLESAAAIRALGAWFRTELASPKALGPANLARPFELRLNTDVAGLRQMLIEYHVGDPGRFAHPSRSESLEHRSDMEVVDLLAPEQILIADHEIHDPRLRLIVRIVDYTIYEARPTE